MTSLNMHDYEALLQLATQIIDPRAPGTPRLQLGEQLAELFQAEAIAITEVNFRNCSSRYWGGYPSCLFFDIGPTLPGFHSYVLGHPVVQCYRSCRIASSVRVSDVLPLKAWKASSAYGFLQDSIGMAHQLILPLSIHPEKQCAVAVMRTSTDFSDRDLEVAQRLEPLLAAAYANQRLQEAQAPQKTLPDPDVRLTPREMQILKLWPLGLTAVAIARRLGVSVRTVEKHSENLRNKLNARDRVSAVVRAQALGMIRSSLEELTNHHSISD
ncbi:response regulator transcription factor [Streptomyces sp. NPDC053079]|uniref:response regulator transcription factor n=1 Tax=Streptomyces sp. NPDC053079 TaxID=3365697 RepID=UPI0037D461A5